MSRTQRISTSDDSHRKTTRGGTQLSRRVVKIMGMFAGLQSAGIVCSAVKMKLVSIWLGSAGVALFGILSTAQETIATFTDLGLRQSTVRDVASQEGDMSRLARVAMLVRRWSLLAGLLGASVMLILAPALGQWFFGDFKGCIPFALVAIAMFFNCLLYGEQSLMQGTGMLRALARGSLWGTVVGLALSIPMFRWMGLQSVPLSFIVYSVAIWGFTLYWRFRPPERVASPGLRQLWREGKGFVRLGILMSLAAFLTSLSRLIFVALLTRHASLEVTGLYQAGDTLVSRYIGLIFSAIGMEFFPRIVAAARSHRRTAAYVNHEITLLLVVVTPVALLFILCRNIIVAILYSATFEPILTFISLAMVGTVMKSVSWCLALCIVARGDGRIYLATEGIDALLSLILLYGGYILFGLDGLGWAYMVWNLGYVIIVWTACRRRYALAPSRGTTLTALLSVALCALACAAMQWLPAAAAAAVIVPAALAYIIPLHRMLTRKDR